MTRFKRKFQCRFGLSHRFQKCNNNERISNIEKIFFRIISYLCDRFMSNEESDRDQLRIIMFRSIRYTL